MPTKKQPTGEEPLKWFPKRGFNVNGFRRAYLNKTEVAWIYEGDAEYCFWWGGPGKGNNQKKGSGTTDCPKDAYKKVLAKLASVWT